MLTAEHAENNEKQSNVVEHDKPSFHHDTDEIDLGDEALLKELLVEETKSVSEKQEPTGISPELEEVLTERIGLYVDNSKAEKPLAANELLKAAGFSATELASIQHIGELRESISGKRAAIEARLNALGYSSQADFEYNPLPTKSDLYKTIPHGAELQELARQMSALQLLNGIERSYVPDKDLFKQATTPRSDISGAVDLMKDYHPEDLP